MPNTKSAKKRVKKIKVRTLRNSMIKSAMKTAIKRFEEAINTQNAEKIKETFVKAVKAVDKAAAKGVIHKNKASRKKSSLAKKLNQVQLA